MKKLLNSTEQKIVNRINLLKKASDKILQRRKKHILLKSRIDNAKSLSNIASSDKRSPLVD